MEADSELPLPNPSSELEAGFRPRGHLHQPEVVPAASPFGGRELRRSLSKRILRRRDLPLHHFEIHDSNRGALRKPVSETGAGKEFEDEFSDDLKHDRPYMVSVANAGPGMNGSQFFVMTMAAPWLDKHAIFGRTIAGFEDIHTIENVKANKTCLSRISKFLLSMFVV